MCACTPLGRSGIWFIVHLTGDDCGVCAASSCLLQVILGKRRDHPGKQLAGRQARAQAQAASICAAKRDKQTVPMLPTPSSMLPTARQEEGH